MFSSTPRRAHWLVAAAFAALIIASASAGGAQGPFRVADLNTATTDGIFLWHDQGVVEDIAVGGLVYFTASDGIHGNELWRTDGTAAGTALVADICPGSCSGEPGSFAVLGGRLYFHADDGVHGMELWSSDGTAAGTSLAADIVPGFDGSSPTDMVALGGQILFAARTLEAGQELWRTDGTAPGTSQVLDVNPGSDSSYPSLLGANASLVFMTASDPGHGRELWVTDGTAAGTQVLDVIAPGPGSGNDQLYRLSRGIFAISPQLLVFVVPSGSGDDLWRSDGTAPGTKLTADHSPELLRAVRDHRGWGRQVLFCPGSERALANGRHSGRNGPRQGLGGRSSCADQSVGTGDSRGPTLLPCLARTCRGRADLGQRRHRCRNRTRNRSR